MRYVLLISADPAAEAPPVTPQGVHDDWVEATEEIRSAGAHVADGRLREVSAARTVSVRGGERIVSDGPFAETKEQLLGFYVVDCENLEEALDFARDLGKANPGGAYEIRPMALFRPGTLKQ